jgi:hypothetical protein
MVHPRLPRGSRDLVVVLVLFVLVVFLSILDFVLLAVLLQVESETKEARMTSWLPSRRHTTPTCITMGIFPLLVRITSPSPLEIPVSDNQPWQAQLQSTLECANEPRNHERT